VALTNFDSAQRASARQPGATPQISTAATRFVRKGQHRPALWNPFRVRVRTGYQPGAAFIRIRGFSCPRLICASLSGSVAALTSSINANTFDPQMSPRTSFVDEPVFCNFPLHCLTCAILRTVIVPPDCRASRACCVPAACRYVRKCHYELSLSK